MLVRITCISKAGGNHENPHVAISELGWIEDNTNKRGASSRVGLYEWIKDGGFAYVRDDWGNTSRVGTAETSAGTKFVRTHKDNVWTDNLLALNEC